MKLFDESLEVKRGTLDSLQSLLKAGKSTHT